MASPSWDPRPAVMNRDGGWRTQACNRAYSLAALRAGIIALVLLGVLALIVLL